MVKGNVVTIIILFMAISVINVGCSKDYIDDLENSGVWLFIQLYILEGGKVEKDLKHRIHS